MRIALIVLAAGASTRFGPQNKLLAEIDGEPLIVRAVRTLSAVRVPPHGIDVFAVVRDGDRAVAEAVETLRLKAQLVINPNAHQGMGTSISAAMRELGDRYDGALIVPGDMPRLTAGFVERLLRAFISAGGELPAHPMLADGQKVGPVVWPRALFGALRDLRGDAGGKGLLADRATAAVRLTASEEEEFLADVDTPDDLSRLR